MSTKFANLNFYNIHSSLFYNMNTDIIEKILTKMRIGTTFFIISGICFYLFYLSGNEFFKLLFPFLFDPHHTLLTNLEMIHYLIIIVFISGMSRAMEFFYNIIIQIQKFFYDKFTKRDQ